MWSLDTVNGDCHSGTTKNAGGNYVQTQLPPGALLIPNPPAFSWIVTYSAGPFTNQPGQAAGLCVGDELNNTYGMEVPVVFV
ncbi:MAG: hypothetical protein M3256_11585 [Actinomycetota bacterium]|nr:hypothetical protein [Actinomycetota bacterium]